MTEKSLAQVLQSVENPAETFRNTDLGWQPYVFEDEYTNWIEEQRAVAKSCAVVDQSYHMEILEIEGPDAVDLLESLSVNSFQKVRDGDPPQAINYLTCNPDGYVIGDVIVFYFGENRFSSVGSEWINNWIRYNAEAGEYNVDLEIPYHPFDDQDPPEFRFQVQGPHAMDVMEEVADGSLPDISFFEMDTIEIDGVRTFALGHGMAAMPGLEIFGPHEHHDEVLDSILEVGEQYGIRQLGTQAYKTGKIGSGWFVAAVPAIYEHDELQGYREWLDADSMEASLSIGGSYESDDITDYYMNPIEQGKSHLIDFDHDFVGKDALQEMMEQEQRERVTLVWDVDDVVDVYASLFREGETSKFINLPDVATRWSAMHYDKIVDDGEMIGLSKYPGYLSYEREMLSLAVVDPEYSEPGTEVSFVWGDETKKQRVERHEPVEIRATVANAPYVKGGRTNL
ncbi:aminomethyltransferase family protein [Halobellus limi]|uniref:Aminomethyl transferase family protein n=1 Tax=Halobellus limi TaxID=699433 RepID=A0A1H6BN81_9EURY|nr:aminomethyltransferase family protein [Halobellus limi]QCC49418.1 aminomethyl transferase family protein [Halobellus limi]SEG62130.1 vanillate/3-O-methylgallate O-demethylase [Halobellus limi]